MAKKTYIAVHNILLSPNPPKYAEPGTRFMIEEKEGERLLGLGAVKNVKNVKDDEEAPAKKAPAKKASAKKADEADGAGDGDGDGLV